MVKILRIFALILCFISMVTLFAACGTETPNSDNLSLPSGQTPNSGADIAFVALADEYQNVFVQSVWSAVEQFAGKEGYSKAPYKVLEGEGASTVQLAVKSGAQVIVLAGIGMDELLLQAQDEYPETKFVLVVENIIEEPEIKDNSVVLGFRAEQAGWLAGYMAMYEAENYFAYFESEDIISRRYALGFFFGVEAAAETLDLSANSIEITPINVYEADTEESMRTKIEDNLGNGKRRLVFANDFVWQEDVLEIAGEKNVMVVSAGYDYVPQSGVSAAVAQSCPEAALSWVLDMWKKSVFPGGSLLYGEIYNSGANLYFEATNLKKFNINVYEEALDKFFSTKAGEYMQTFIHDGYVPSPQGIDFSRIKPNKNTIPPASSSGDGGSENSALPEDSSVV